MTLSAQDTIFLDRAYELARRGTGSTSPNPLVGAVVVSHALVVGEGYHHRAGEPHAEVHALREAGESARGATLYVSLEPCDHHGRTPPCTKAVIEAGIARVVIGAADPNPLTAGAGIRALREARIDVVVSGDAQGAALIAPFARAMNSDRPFVTLKIAMSLDGYIASRRGEQQWLTGERARTFVRELRIAHDAIAVGAGTIRVDDPQLTVRPPHARGRTYERIVFCQSGSVDPGRAVFASANGYAKTIVVAPRRARERFSQLSGIAEIVYAEEDESMRLDLSSAMTALFARGITSILCEGGPTIGAELLRARLVDRLVWLVAPLLLSSPDALPALAGAEMHGVRQLRIEAVERLDPDVAITGTFDDV